MQLTTEQQAPFSFVIKDGRGRPAKIDGEPVAASSDETVGAVSALTREGDKWSGVLSAVAPSPEGTTQRVTVTADANLGEGVEHVVGVMEFTVTLDPRTGARMVELEPGTPVDKE